jgi:molybdate transport system regulatory protein
MPPKPSVGVSLRVVLRRTPEATGMMGPGKANLLEAIKETGSISAAGRRMGMSYRRAWDLVAAMNATFREPLVNTAIGGLRGGGAELTPLGQTVLDAYRGLALAALEAGVEHIAIMRRACRK